jgi:glycosyl transferase family 25
MKIYFISLESDKHRVAEFKKQFPIFFSKMNWIKAVNGKKLLADDYFLKLYNFFSIKEKIITPSELGCTLSHLNALNDFLATDEKYCLILEDDAIGTDNEIKFIKSLLEKSEIDGCLILMDQRFYSYEKYILGKNNGYGVYQLSNFSIKFIFGTCAYLLDRKTAQLMVDFHRNNINYADAWNDFYKFSTVKFYYSPVIGHPIDKNNSTIEGERSMVNTAENNFFKRIYKQGFFWKIYNRVRNDIIRINLLYSGFKQIHLTKK